MTYMQKFTDIFAHPLFPQALKTALDYAQSKGWVGNPYINAVTVAKEILETGNYIKAFQVPKDMVEVAGDVKNLFEPSAKSQNQAPLNGSQRSVQTDMKWPIAIKSIATLMSNVYYGLRFADKVFPRAKIDASGFGKIVLAARVIEFTTWTKVSYDKNKKWDALGYGFAAASMAIPILLERSLSARPHHVLGLCGYAVAILAPSDKK